MRSLSLLSAGSNARGQLATGNLDDAHQFMPCNFVGATPGSLPEHIVAVRRIACGANHTLALLLDDDGGRTELWGCGDGSRGQLGPSYHGEAEVNETVFCPLDLRLEEVGLTPEGYTVRLIAAGWETSYVVFSCLGCSDILLSFGGNDFGNLGIGSPRSTPKPNSKTNSMTRLPVHVVDLRRALDAPTGIVTVLSLSAGPHHVLAQVCLRKPDGSSLIYLVGWGASRHGQLGPLLDPSGRPLPTCPSPVVLRCTSPSDQNDNIVVPALGTQHTVYAGASGALVGLGSNRKGQLEGLATLGDVAQVACTWNGTYVLLSDGRVVATGSNTHAQLGRGPAAAADAGGLAQVAFPFAAETGTGTGTETETGRVAKLVCGSEHVLCLVDVSPSVEGLEGEGRKAREVWGWGWNEHGNLGIGGTTDSGVPVRIWPPSPAARTHSPEGEVDGGYGDVVDVWAGCGTSWILIQK